MRVLCVAEKPSIAKSITQILSSGQFRSRQTQNKYIRNYDFPYRLPGHPGHVDFTVTSVTGHLTDTEFPEEYRRWRSVDPFVLFDVPIVEKVASNNQTISSNLKTEARHANRLMIWTDCDREGEAIGGEVVGVCKGVNRNIVVERARFSAIIADQIHRAAQSPTELDWRQVKAVDARRALDLRIGSAFTRMLTMALQDRFADELGNNIVSYGPCQFPTLGFVVDQYERVQSFVPETFWYIHVSLDRIDESLGSKDGLDEGGAYRVDFRWKRGHLFDWLAALVLFEQCVQHGTATVTRVTDKQTKKLKPLPLTTVELQKAGSRLLRLSPKRVLDIAESLYQKGFLSYPRTETDQYDKDFDFMRLIEKQTVDPAWGAFAQSLKSSEFERPRNGRKNDKAHPPIHPTAHNAQLGGDDKRVYEFITRRFLASCSKDAVGRQTTVDVVIADEEFTASGLIILDRNYLDVYPYDKWGTNFLPSFRQGETFVPTVCELREGKTSRPSLLTEADLVSLMDKNGIGTDATIAEHIAKVIEREYVMIKQEGQTKYLVPSTLGVALVEGFNAMGFEKSLSKPQLRRETEYRMKLICDGHRTKEEVVEESLTEYREVFIRSRREFRTLVETVQRYLRGVGRLMNPQAGEDGGTDDPAGGEDSEPDNYDDGPDGGGGGGGGGGGRGRGRGSTAGGRGRRGRAGDVDGRKRKIAPTKRKAARTDETGSAPYAGSSAPSASRGSGGGGGGGGTGTEGACFKCGQLGHWANACPSGEGEARGAGGRARVSRRGGWGARRGTTSKRTRTS